MFYFLTLTFYLWLYSMKHMVKECSGSEREKKIPLILSGVVFWVVFMCFACVCVVVVVVVGGGGGGV